MMSTSGDEKLDERFVINLLGPAALWVHQENPGGLVDQRDLVADLTRTFVETYGAKKRARKGSPKISSIWCAATLGCSRSAATSSGFLHLTLEEYLAARALVEVVEDTEERLVRGRSGLARGAASGAGVGLTKGCPAVALAALAAPAIGDVCGRPVILAGECLLDIGRNGATRAWNAVVDRLLSLLADPQVSTALRVEGGHVLGRLGDPRLLDSRTGEAAGYGERPVPSYWCAIDARPFWHGDDRAEDDDNTTQNDADADNDDTGEDSQSEDAVDQVNSHPPTFDSRKLQRVTLPYAFKIGRYPVTNAEYQCFIEDSGYDPEQEWWTEQGRAFLKPGGHRYDNQQEWITLPRLWVDPQYNNPTQPVVGISWYEAAAYCNWLTARGHQQGWLSATYEIRLPTWLEWERAARHTDQRRYPWGSDDPTPEHANYGKTGIGQPSSVGCFPQGVAECGALDIAGNVMEWLASYYDKPEVIKPVRDFTQNRGVLLSDGASWREKERLFSNDRSAFPNGRSNVLGMRVVCSPRSSG
ncbi:MAG: SUMF1/EgtB/PvdO family nonheme iron enzyme [Kouleothrix sp.]|nr:SUMF1/EgtB/PvdO family nonheme iron enzyme [Kouleothrix sp.]